MPKITEHGGASNADAFVEEQKPIPVLAQPQERPGESGDVHAARNTGESDESAEDSTEGQDERPYAEWSKTELRAEIDRRNEERDEEDRIAVSGTAADLAGRLIEDDEYENEE